MPNDQIVPDTEPKTYKKMLKSINVYSIDGGDLYDVADTEDNPIASKALGQFLKGETMVIIDRTANVEIPFHAVDYIEVTEVESEPIEIADPYGCESDGDDDGSGK